jgi:glc operon protein GlcG
MAPQFHLAKDAFPLHLLFQCFQRLVNIVVANDDLQKGLLVRSGGFVSEQDHPVHRAHDMKRPENGKVTKGEAMRNKTVLTLSDAQAIATAARAEANRRSWAVTIAVVDDAGLLLLLERADGARPQTAEIATLKARSAAVTHRPGKTWEDAVKNRPGVVNFPDAFPIQGGVPIVFEREVIGGVGISGVQSHEDEQVAIAGIAALGL